VFEADGVKSLNFNQAVAAGRKYVAEARAEAKAIALGPAPTIATACEAYLTAIESRQIAKKGKPTRDSRSRLETHIIADRLVSETPLHNLQSSDLIAWKKRVRAKAISETTFRRISNDFRAALNSAGLEHRSRLPDGFAIVVKDGFAINTADPSAESERPNIILDDTDVSRLIQAAKEIDEEQGWEGDLHLLVVGLAGIGARFSQLAKVPVEDLQIVLKRIMVPSSNKGRTPNKRPAAAVPIGDDVISVLRRSVVGRSGREPLFMRWGYKRAGGIKWEKHERRKWLAAEITEPFREIVTRAELSADVSAYAFRHSSIVRGLRKGLPVRLVAALHDTSSEMIERYYSAYIVDALDAMAAAAVVPLIDLAPTS
jgi:site-specific recombinase XerD